MGRQRKTEGMKVVQGVQGQTRLLKGRIRPSRHLGPAHALTSRSSWKPGQDPEEAMHMLAYKLYRGTIRISEARASLGSQEERGERLVGDGIIATSATMGKRPARGEGASILPGSRS